MTEETSFQINLPNFGNCQCKFRQTCQRIHEQMNTENQEKRQSLRLSIAFEEKISALNKVHLVGTMPFVRCFHSIQFNLNELAEYYAFQSMNARPFFCMSFTYRNQFTRLRSFLFFFMNSSILYRLFWILSFWFFWRARSKYL